VLAASFFPVGAAPAHGLDPSDEIEPFVAQMSDRHGLDRAMLAELLGEARVLQSILDAISRPAEAKPWHAYRKIFIKRQHTTLLERAREAHGVPPEIIVAIIGVETLYGASAGRLRVLDALVTLGFRYPRRADFFRRELESFLLLARDEGLDPRTVKGSYAGAMGIPQFIPSSYRRYAVDFDGDGRRDLVGNVSDAIGSVGNYLADHGWRRDGGVAAPARVTGEAYRDLVEQGYKPATPAARLPSLGVATDLNAGPGDQAALVELEGEEGAEHWAVLKNFYVITRYNHSPLYAMAVYQLSREIARRFRSGDG
jgi:membrane-bound lytic murein transglycosylase B